MGALMSKWGLAVAVCLSIVRSNSSTQSTDPKAMLAAAKSLRCQFPSGGAMILGDSNPHYERGRGVDGVFDDIDRRNGTARVIGSAGAGDVQVIAGSESLTFIELTPIGFPLVTVVFASFRPGSQELLASDSHHAMINAHKVVVEQYYGSCRVLQ